MIFTVLGIEESEGEFKGNRFSGRNVYAQYPDSYQSDRLVGSKVDRLWIPDKLRVGAIKVGDNIEVFYNKYGKVDSVTVV